MSPAEREAMAMQLGAQIADLCMGYPHADVIAVLSSLLGSSIAIAASSDTHAQAVAGQVGSRLSQFVAENRARNSVVMH